MSDELKPCPRCGGAVKVDSPPDGGAMGAVGYWCEGCGDGNCCWDGPYQSRQEAVAAANRRTPGPATAKMVEFLKRHSGIVGPFWARWDRMRAAFLAEHEPT